MTKAPTKHRINVVLTLRQYRALQGMAGEHGETVATMIRQCIDLGIDRQGDGFRIIRRAVDKQLPQKAAR